VNQYQCLTDLFTEYLADMETDTSLWFQK